MAEQDWKTIFKNNTSILNQGDVWHLEFDDSIVPEHPNPGWKEYIRHSGGRFSCSQCRRAWPSNRVMVVFHMRLMGTQGIVKVRRFRQNCKRCNSAPMEKPSITSDNIEILLENLVKKIRIKCYNETLDGGFRPPASLNVNNPHEPSHCEGCILGICNRN